MILITGGMGFIGLNTAHELLKTDADLVLTRYHVRREPDFLAESLATRIAVETLDIEDTYALYDLMNRYQPDSIVHLAVPPLHALGAAAEAQTNLHVLLNVLEAARTYQIRRLTIASSAAVYAGAGPGPWREDLPLPIASGSSTGAFKKIAETLADHYAERTGLSVTLLRIGAVYGPLYHSMANLPSRMAHAAVRGREPGLASSPRADDGMDYCYVKDCARAVSLLHLAPDLRHRVYNIGGGRVTTNREIADALTAIYPDRHFALSDQARGSASDRFMDLSRIRDEIAYEPAYGTAKAVADYCAWLESHDE